jgi:hypothetical protein
MACPFEGSSEGDGFVVLAAGPIIGKAASTVAVPAAIRLRRERGVLCALTIFLADVDRVIVDAGQIDPHRLAGLVRPCFRLEGHAAS